MKVVQSAVYAIALVVGIHAAIKVDPECVGIRDRSIFRHQTDCSRYYSCRGGRFEGHQCLAGLYWDQTYRICRAPATVNCNQGPFVTVTTAKPILPTVPPIRTTTVGSIDIESNPNLSNYKCPNTGVSTVPHKNSCSKYVICFDGTPVEQNCAPGLHFDVLSGQCTFPVFARCSIQGQICPMWNNHREIIFIADKFDCAKYYYCYNGEPHANSCAQGLHWDPLNNWCTPAEESRCTNFTPYKAINESLLTPKNVPCADKSAHWVEHPRNCRYYYLCYQGQSTQKRCDVGLLWDSNTGSCNFQEAVDCKNDM
ncbi:protein obstructor-E-like [Toxorhynchites rutilus septentrionalis]|uniref:protein obstructor-E-like n=1 Tax=Toxorhynchites rutilus septentrionalis TaxID=329112 RepID=UPI0024789182|nr:protein obstructor-E-like [Toxorhynchites rutilus septentrionalis]